MDKIISAEKTRLLEQSVFSLGIDSFAVMEKAALRIADEIKERFSKTAKMKLFFRLLSIILIFIVIIRKNYGRNYM